MMPDNNLQQQLKKLEKQGYYIDLVSTESGREKPCVPFAPTTLPMELTREPVTEKRGRKRKSDGSVIESLPRTHDTSLDSETEFDDIDDADLVGNMDNNKIPSDSSFCNSDETDVFADIATQMLEDMHQEAKKDAQRAIVDLTLAETFATGSQLSVLRRKRREAESHAESIQRALEERSRKKVQSHPPLVTSSMIKSSISDGKQVTTNGRLQTSLKAASTLDKRPPLAPLNQPVPLPVGGPTNATSSTVIHRKESTSYRKVRTSELLKLSNEKHPWSRDVIKALKYFGLEAFRPNQLEAINATLGAKDVFVLMPTGGGKSLCYQLPSIISSGKTKGVTLVVSPLLSLMQDQVVSLVNRGIPCLCYNGDLDSEKRRFVVSQLKENPPIVKLLYITPEMLVKSVATKNIIKDLHRNQQLARIVIDEAHCVSQWGHDFRPDYKSLGTLKREFPNVPLIALTATATERVRIDVKHHLSIPGCVVLKQSFNRPNLVYEIRPKTKSSLDDVAELIKGRFAGKSGIIYCLARKDCENVAKKLRDEHGIKAEHYHAGLDKAEKIQIQQKWQQGRTDVIVATIAFGMGIDKPDVRFVMHHSLPSSLEGYYQETGRAGRDGKEAICILYYRFGDKALLDRLIDNDKGIMTPEQKENRKSQIRRVVGYCENRVECRRLQVLSYFGEYFDPAECNGTCDNCSSGQKFEEEDVSEDAKKALQLVRELQMVNITLVQACDAYRGSKTRVSTQKEFNSSSFFGKGNHLSKTDCERLFHQLILIEALSERSEVNNSGYPQTYLQSGRTLSQVLNGSIKVIMAFEVDRPKAKPKMNIERNQKRGTPVQRVAEEIYEDHEFIEDIDSSSMSVVIEVEEQGKPPINQVVETMTMANGPPAGTTFTQLVSGYSLKSPASSSFSSRESQQLNHESPTTNPALGEVLHRFFVELQGVRNDFVHEHDLRPSQVFRDSELLEMRDKAPMDLASFVQLNCMRNQDKKYDLFGRKFLDVCQKYSKEIKEIQQQNNVQGLGPLGRSEITVDLHKRFDYNI